jgi:hypothetical protein
MIGVQQQTVSNNIVDKAKNYNFNIKQIKNYFFNSKRSAFMRTFYQQSRRQKLDKENNDEREVRHKRLFERP